MATPSAKDELDSTLTDAPSVAAEDRDPVEMLAEEFAERLRRGEHPSVSDYAASHPEHAEQLLELLPAVAQMEHLKRFRKSASPAETPSLPDRFGDFRIVRELGRGGMGVVFEAVQESLGRPVALKVLASHSRYDGIRHERFIREAHAAARLHHSNIVPVFGVGEQGGIPYYVMQLIRGHGLNAVAHRWRIEQGREDLLTGSASTVPNRGISSRPLLPAPHETEAQPKYGNWRFVAEVGLQAAEALHYAHKQGVLHRDVKPGNLLLDSSKRVWITDFGLAKVVDLNGLTPSGDILGTLQYLAPECLTGDSDPRSDVYGVGATLYELLTLIPPYPADSPARLLKRVADSDATAPRQLNPEIPHDLETIVLKAMAREPDHRYVSARELARDLQAFLDDRPIKARRQSWHSKFWRLCRRNPANAILSASIILVLVLSAIGGWVGYGRTTRALEAEAVRLQEAERARHEARETLAKLEENLGLSLDTFKAVFEAAGGSRQTIGYLWLPHPDRHGPFFDRPGGPFGHGPNGGPRGPKEPGGPDGSGVSTVGLAADAKTKAAMLEAVLVFYDKFAQQNTTNPKLRFEAAKAHRRVGEARLCLDQPEKAAGSIRSAIALLKSLQAEDPDNEEFGAELVENYLLAATGLTEVDQADLLWAIDYVRRQPAEQRRQSRAIVAIKLATLQEHAGNLSDAEIAYRTAIGELSALEGGDDRSPPVVTDQAWARYSLAGLLAREKHWAGARQILLELIMELQRVPEHCGRGSFPQVEVACNAYEMLLGIDRQLGDVAEASQAAREIERLRRELSEGGPGGPHGGPKNPPPPKKK